MIVVKGWVEGREIGRNGRGGMVGKEGFGMKKMEGLFLAKGKVICFRIH